VNTVRRIRILTALVDDAIIMECAVVDGMKLGIENRSTGKNTFRQSHIFTTNSIWQAWDRVSAADVGTF
jgi:hypothetical protein